MIAPALAFRIIAARRNRMLQKRFRALRIIGTFYKILAWIALLIGALGGVALIVGGGLGGVASMEREGLSGLLGGALAGSVGGLFFLIGGAIYFIILYAIGDSIYLFLTIEENTRETSMLLRQISQGSQPTPPGNP
jgi:hypothetical protein